MNNLGNLIRVENLRQVWPKEAQDFTSWLAREENLKLLGNSIGIELDLEEQESPVGSFSVDLYATEQGTGRKVVIENQLEATNHDHLGKIITYASGKEAQVVIWIVKEAREEYSQAIEWLNEHTDEKIGFFLIEIELWKIGDSRIAPKFNIVQRPNDWAKSQKQASTLTPARRKQLEFWQYFAENAFEKESEFNKLFRKRKPQPYAWYSLAAGSSTYHINLSLNTQKSQIEAGAYIQDDKELYGRYEAAKAQIEQIFGCKVHWFKAAKDARFSVIKNGCPLNDASRWEEYLEWFCDAAIKTREVLKKFG